MNLYKTALSALLLAPMIGGISVKMIQGYQSAKEMAECYAADAETQIEQTMALLEDELDIDEAAYVSDDDILDESISNSVIRFHIRANSDSEDDQALKLKVRDAVLTYLEPELAEAENLNEARTIMEKHLADIETIALSVIQEEGYDYDVQAYLTREEFPLKSYGDLLFPAGEYEALRVDIGSSEGGNWWCVMYPGLCFVDTASGVVATEGKEELQQILTPEEYEALLICPDEEIQVEYHSYFWDLLMGNI